MSKSWSKEDRFHFDSSEVMRELETKVLDTIRRADILSQKISNANVDVQKTEEAIAKQKELNSEIKQTQNLMNAAHDDSSIDLVDDEQADDGLRNEIRDDLMALAAAAIAEGNVKLAYRIERTIDEIMEKETPCL